MANKPVKIRSKDIAMVPIAEIKLNPKNRNKHPQEQIERLEKLIAYQGFRNPIVVSKLSGLCVAGEGRFLAAKNLGFKSVPVIYQDFDDSDQETAYGISDNAIATWADLDFAGINLDLPDLGPDFEIDMLGISDFGLDAPEREPGIGARELSEESFTTMLHQCPKCGFEFGKAKPDGAS